VRFLRLTPGSLPVLCLQGGPQCSLFFPLRVSLAVDILERTPDLATVDRLPEKDGEMLHTPTPTAGGPPDVTYAQLDHRILTQRMAQAASPRSMEPTAESSTYAALARH